MSSTVVSVHVHLPGGAPAGVAPEIFALAQAAGRADFFSVVEMTIPSCSHVIRVLQFQLRGQGRLDAGKQLVAQIERRGFEGRLHVRRTSAGVATDTWWPATPSWPTWEWSVERTRDWLERGHNDRPHTASDALPRDEARSAILADTLADTPADTEDEAGELGPDEPTAVTVDATAWDWIRPQLGEFGKVGGLSPEGYDRCILIDHTPPGAEGEWRTAGPWLLAPLAEALAAGTGTPDQAWFAIWEGYGFDEDVRRGLERLPSFELPGRRYHVLTGRVTDAAAIELPASGTRWAPDLWWPADRRWFVATDVDLSWSYVSGEETTISAIESLLPDRTRTVTRDQWNYDAHPFRR